MITRTRVPDRTELTGEGLFSLLVALGKLGYPDPEPEAIARGLRDATVKRYPAGEQVILQGENPDNLFIVHSGRALVSKESQGGRRVRLCELGEGDVFGEISLLTGQLRTATVTTLEDCELFVLSPRDFRFLLDSSATFEYRLRALAEARESATLV
jgi:CRP-like cAMP-binding protein